jgi:hypothetical protein
MRLLSFRGCPIQTNMCLQRRLFQGDTAYKQPLQWETFAYTFSLHRRAVSVSQYFRGTGRLPFSHCAMFARPRPR